MATVIFYEKPGCGNNTKQKVWLAASGHTVLAKNLLTEKWTAERLRPFFGDLPVAQWFNPAAFAVNDLGTFGDVARGAYYGPSLHSWDMGMFKNFRFTNDMNVQFRAEFFNVFNHPNNPTAIGGDGVLLTRNSGSAARVMQVGLRLIW